jgi:peroxiredoxin
MAIGVGDSVPQVALAVMGESGPEEVSTNDLFKGRKVVAFALPGAFTPTCSAKHLPGFVANADAIKAKGVDSIMCLSVNDVFVMDAWGKDQDVGDSVAMVADGSGALANALGLELDLTERGLGVRSQRYSMIVDDGVVSALNVDDGGAFEISSAEKILEQL